MTDYCKTCFHIKENHYPVPTENVGVYTNPCSYNKDGLCECEDYIHGETRVTGATGAQKGTKEERFDLIPVPALTYLARLYGKGALKYADHNWRLGYDWSKSYSAAQRHMNSFWAGEDMDPETQVPHVINAAFHMFALATYLTEHPELDDRFETRESRSDEKEAEEIRSFSTNVEDHSQACFYVVRSRDRGYGWVNQGYYFSKENAQARVYELTEKNNDSHIEVKLFEGIFQDDSTSI